MDYLNVARADDLALRQDRLLYRAFEIFPGLLAWGTIVLAVIGSWLFPVQTALFVIAFVIFWLVRTVYLSFHLRAGYRI
ncbi:MAG: hypothetical protein QF775_02170, partial [archaeon]|nr:hypothetical protein [archaeon]